MATPFVFRDVAGATFWVALYGWLARERFVSGRRDHRNAPCARAGYEADRATP